MKLYILIFISFFSLPLFAGDRLIVNDRIDIQSNTTFTSIISVPSDQRDMFDSNTCNIKYDLRLFPRVIENQVFMIVNDKYSYIRGLEAVKLYVKNAGVIKRISNSNDPLPSSYEELKTLLIKNNIKINSAESDFLYTKVNLNLISQDTNNKLTIECKLLGYQSYDEVLLYLNDSSYFKIDPRY